MGDPDTRTHDPQGRPLRARDRDNIDVATRLNARGVCHEDIADVCGVRPVDVPALLRGERV